MRKVYKSMMPQKIKDPKEKRPKRYAYKNRQATMRATILQNLLLSFFIRFRLRNFYKNNHFNENKSLSSWLKFLTDYNLFLNHRNKYMEYFWQGEGKTRTNFARFYGQNHVFFQIMPVFLNKVVSSQKNIKTYWYEYWRKFTHIKK
jgi:hypothetical protein